MNRAEYDSVDAVNFSTAKELLTTPAHYQDALAKRDEPESEEEKTRYATGTLAHAMVLENKDLLHLYAVKPKGMSFATTAGKLWQAQQTLPILTQDEAEGVPRMAEAIANDPDASAILRLCPQRELAIIGEIQGILAKGLLDGYGATVSARPMIADIKTARDVSPHPRHFPKTADKLHYDMQAEWYSRLAMAKFNLQEPPAFAWITVTNKRPFIVQCYYPTPDTWRSGSRKVDAAIARLKACRETGIWGGYGGGLMPLSVPDYAVRREY